MIGAYAYTLLVVRAGVPHAVAILSAVALGALTGIVVEQPTVGLAPKLADEIYGWVTRLAAAGASILLVDHNIRQVISMSELVYVMSLGRIVASGPRARFAEDLHGQVRQWLGIAL